MRRRSSSELKSALRALAGCLVCLVMALFPFAICLGQLNLPQPKETVVLPEASRQALVNTLAAGSYSLDRESSALFMAGLPKPFGDSCGQVVGNWGDAKRTAQWTVRVLVNLRALGGNHALLALRCGSSAPNLDSYYDERPALVSFAGDSATLRFIPLADECGNCSPFYHLEFSKILTVRGALLMEMRASDSTTTNPCCDGGDEASKDRLVLLTVPDGQQVLALEEMTEDISEDDSDDNGGGDVVCHSKFEYARDVAGNLESIRSVTQCTDDNKPLPETKEHIYRWNANARRFDEQEAKISKSLAH